MVLTQEFPPPHPNPPQPSVNLRGCGSTYHRAPLCCDPHNGITPLWSCCSLTHDHADPWMGISAGFSKPSICASQYCHRSNHSLNQNTKSNFTWMPQHKYLIMAENKSLSFCPPSSYRSSQPRSLFAVWIQAHAWLGHLWNGSYEFFTKIHSCNQAWLGGRLCHRVTSCAAMLAHKSCAVCIDNGGRKRFYVFVWQSHETFLYYNTSDYFINILTVQ